MSTSPPKVTYAMAASRRQGAAETTSGAMNADQLREFLLRQQQQQQQLLEQRLQQEVQQQNLLQQTVQLKQEERLQQEQCRLQQRQEQHRLHHLQQERLEHQQGRFQEQQCHHQQMQDQLHCQHLQQVKEELKFLHQQHQANHVILQKLLQLCQNQLHPHSRSLQLPEELNQLHDQQQQIAQLLVQWQHRQKQPLNPQLQEFLHQLQLRIQFQQQRAQQLLLHWQQVARQQLQQPQHQEPPLQMSNTSCPTQLTSSQTSYEVSLPQREPPELMTTQPQMQQLPTFSTPISSLLDQLAMRTAPATIPSSVPSTPTVTTSPAAATAVASAPPHGAVPLPRSSGTTMRPVPRYQLQHHPQLQAPSALQSYPLQQFRQSQPLTPSAWWLPSGMTPYPNPNKQPHHLADSPAMQTHQLPQSWGAVCQGMPPPPFQTTRNEKHQDKVALSNREPRGWRQRMVVGGNLNAHIDRQHTGDPRRSRHVDANRSENPTTPMSSPPSRREPDAKLLEKFRSQYAEQEEEDVVAEHLREQSRTKNGTIGTLCIDVCLDIIDCHEVTFVVTDTGTGKSTLIPKALAERDPRAMVVNCQPRRTSAISLAKRVATLMGDKPGETVGFSVRGEHVGELGKTRVMYVTNYTLFLHLMSHDPSQIPFTHIILDEFHERNSEVEVMLLLLKMALQRYPNQFKVVLCSASGQVEQWRSFFSEITIGVYNQANRMFDIHEYYLEDICKMLGMYCSPRAIKKNNTVHSLQLQEVLLIIKKMLEFLAGVAAPQHSILVFLPGRTNVEHMWEWIRSNFNEQLDPIAWYSDVDLSFIQDAIVREAITKKKVYLATDIAEVSVTIPDVVFVIDSGMSKRPLISERDPHSTAFPPLQLLWENTMNAQQRRGRAGRVQQGFYFSMISEAQKNVLAHGDSRISNEVITELVLHTLQLTTAPFAVMGLCHYQPRLVSVTHSLVTLRDGGFVLPETDALATTECVRRAELNEETRARQAWDQMITEEMAKESKPQATSAPESGLADTRLPTPKGPSHLTLPIGASLDGAPVTDPLSLKYVITVKGLVAAHLPVSVEASSTVFYGLLYGIPNLAIIAAAVEATRSPFNVPYHVTDLLERATVRNSVVAVMEKFKGHLKSDIIASVGAVLAYMDMQRNGLSDEGQEEWCSTRFLSRTRLIDVTNLLVQMRSQIQALIPFVDVDDVDILLSQFDKYAPLLNFIVVATHTQWGFYINHDEANVTRNSYDGTGIFFQMRCARDMFVASVCPWAQHSVCVPLSLQIAYKKLRGTVATQVSPAIFNLALLIFSYRVWFERLKDDPKVYQLQVCYMNVFQTFHCDEVTAKQIIQIRRMQCARLHTLQLLAEGRVETNDTCETAASLRAIASDFGLPDVAYEQPHLIPAVLEQSLTQLLHRLQESSKVREAFCRVVQHCPPSETSSLSLLIHSNNGIVAPAAICGTNSAQAAAQEAARVERLKTAAVVEHQLNSSSSDSETGHVPQFTFDD